MKEAIALLSNDWHLSKDNIDEFKKNWQEMLSVCCKYDIEDVLIGGDFFTARASQTLATLLAGRQSLDKGVEQGLRFTIAEGNHDLVDQEAFEGYNHLWKGLKSIDVVDTHKALYWEGCDFVLLIMSYFPEDGSFLERLEYAVADTLLIYNNMNKGNIVLYIHEGVHGALGDFEIPGELPQEPLLGFKSVLCGHYHNRVRIQHTNIEYIGSTRQANFGEDEEKGYTILYSDGSYEFVKNEANTRYQTVNLDASAIDSFSLKKDDRYKYKVKVKCSETQAKNLDKQKLIDLGFHKVEVVSEIQAQSDIVAAADIQEKYDKQGMKKEYQCYCDERAIDSKLGIKYLEG